MARVATALLLLALIAPAALSAQAPVVTSEGDPSIDADTIYALTVDPAEYAEEDYVLLLDDGILIQELDGTGSRTYRMVAQILNREAVDQWAEHTWGYDGDRDVFRLNWIKVLDLEGNVISDGPLHEQVMDLPVPEQSPVYTNWKRVRVSLAGVEPGTIVDYSYTVETVDPVRPGDYFSSWSISTGGTIRRSRLILDVPIQADFRVLEENLQFDPKVTEENGRRVTEWADQDLAWWEPEMFAALWEADFLQHLTLSGPSDWSEIGAWYAELAKDRYGLDDDMQAAAEASFVEAGADTPLDRLKELYRWVAQDFRYISISLGQGGYQPRPSSEVFETRSGDCKDKTTLFISLARDLGFEAYPVLLSSYGGVEEDLPSIKQFDHVIAAVKLHDQWTYLDLTAELIPFGEVSPSYQGEFGLIVLDDGTTETIEFPEAPPEENLQTMELKGELSSDGSFVGWYEERSIGAFQYESRGLFSQEFTERQLERLADAIASNLVTGSTGDSLQVFDGRDLNADPVVRIRLSAPRSARDAGPAGWILEIPLAANSTTALTEGLARELDRRTTPIDVAQIVGPIRRETVLEYELPEGWTASLPNDVVIDSPFGHYESTYSQAGRTLTITRTITGWEGTEPKEMLPDLIDFLERLGEDDASYVVLDPGG